MIYPVTTGKPGEMLRLTTLETLWVQGKLRMWGRWSYIGNGHPGNIFNQLLVSKKITRTGARDALRLLKKSGTTRPELEQFLREILNGKQKSYLAYCTDSEALIIDRVIGAVLADHPALKALLHQRYEGRGMSKRKIAEKLQEKYPDWSYVTCRRRIDQWLYMVEYMLYIPLRDSIDRNV
ncbi:DUF1133 family protein [Escherichia coli]|uniref:DUF1133 family protein n=1 Tax=Escherichia coli TaxID=562 RepID=UPI0005CCD849|nr:DUF1133 family protein [Escherichia coli]EHW2741450.1 DUF1133 family protein [Escherichia coli]EHX7847965.1 DUF1133 family protein [Escherichia coli]EHY2965780.1 DUF1133 family protein [Escherichia coli]ELX0475404.1 DUF1133 family protein [Escherichia coli]ELX0480587.1 DUF1133 family protein [Escherichia coli]